MTTNNHQAEFERIFRDAGIPITDAEMRAEWDQVNEDLGSQISNDSKWSPFWRLISEIVTTPAMWVVQFLINQLLPNSFIKTASGMFLDILAWALDLTRKPAVGTVGFITFTRDDTGTNVIVPAGTRIQSTSINGTIYELITTTDKSFENGQATAKVEAKAAQTGAAFNLAPGYYTVLPEPVTGVVSVKNEGDWITTAGADEEKDDDLRLRCRNQFTAVGQFHHDAAYTAIITQFAGISPDYVRFEHGAPRGAGTANAYIMIDSGAPGQEFVDQINDHITNQGYHGHGDDMLCFPMPGNNNNLTVDVWPKTGLTTEQTSELMHGVEDMIRCAFRQNQDYSVTKTMPYSRFSFSQLATEVHAKFSARMASIEFSLGDITSQMDIPVLASLTMNQKEPVSQ